MLRHELGHVFFYEATQARAEPHREATDEYNAGVLAETRGDRDTAKAHYEAALQIFPRCTKCLDNLGWLNSDSRELTALPLVRVARLVLGSCVVSSNG